VYRWFKEWTLLKLKKLQILGFKSFCDRSDLRFHGEGIAAIVGPNGCGKSNISDAIAWVLGEQSAKTLRGARMEDVIFAGTRDRKPTGMAEVSLTLIDPDMYEAGEASTEPEIEVLDDMPAGNDWDEASVRAKAADETDQYTEEVRPGQIEELAASPAAAAGPETPSAERLAPSPTEPAPSDASAELAATTNAQAAHVGPAVVLKIRRRKFKPVFKKGEIVVTRRLFRSGESEYLLNGKLCRLRDIQDIFMGTGLGPESYAIIEQGRIGQILSSKPTDRRAIIEEAAGITKFKTRKRLAEARLEEAKQNLARINDIFDEVTRQMNSLKRQANKAERYARLRDEMRAKLRLVLASKFTQLQREIADTESELTLISEAMQVQGETLRGLEGENAAKTQRGYAIDDESKLNRERLAAINRETDRATSRRRNNEERCAELQLRAQTAEQEIAQTAERLAQLEAERESNRKLLQIAADEVAAAQQEAAQAQQEAQAAAIVLSGVERDQEQRRIAVMEAVSAASSVHNQITRAQERIVGLERELQRLVSELQSSNVQLETFGGQRGQITFEFESASQNVATLAQQIDANRALLAEKRAAETESKLSLDSLRAEYATALGKKGSLEAVIAEHGYSTESVRRLFQSGALQEGVAPAGGLADFLEVEDRYEHVVEDFLRDELNYIVVKSWDAADEGLRLLRSDVDGRATFLVHPHDAQAKFSFVLDEAAHQAPRPDTVQPLKHSIRVLNGFGKSLEVILPKLRDGYIVPDAALGRELALENPDAFFLSQSGECFHNVTVTGGKQRAEGPLSMKRELREVLRTVDDLERALRNEQTRAATLSREIGELTARLEYLDAERRECERAALTSGHSLKQLDTELARIRERIDTGEHERTRVASERSSTEAAIFELQDEAQRHHERRSALEAEVAAGQDSLVGLRAARDAAVATSSEMMARVAALEERRRAAAAALARIESLVSEVQARVEHLARQQEASAAERFQRQAENEEIDAQLVGLTAEHAQAEIRELELQAESEEVRARLSQLEEELKAARAQLDLARDRRGELSANAARLGSDQQHMSETSLNELGVPPQEILADASLTPMGGELLAQEDALYRDMRTRLDAMGPVNMMALEEYKEAAQRHEFLDTQRKDLLESIENTQSAIREIETVSRQKFEEAFARINENFKATFSKLFGGGQALMRLTDELNSAESGIDVVASPPGKKLQNVLLLSGGEKALTAFALLVGIFQYQPSPFCILDEVDAPLDEANIGRFTTLVQEMSAQTQFVIITHSKKTMSVAPVMYGVTMQEPGVSKLVSVRFNTLEQPQSATA